MFIAYMSKIPRLYSDFCWRLVYQRFYFERSYKEVASQLFVWPKSIYESVSTFLATSDVKSCHICRMDGNTKLFSNEECVICLEVILYVV